jgi:signal transduction histidine kinase
MGQTIPLSEMPNTSRVLAQGKPLVLANVQSQPLPAQTSAAVISLDIHTIMFIPLTVRGTTIGAMAVGSDQTGRVFTAEEVSLAETIAADIAAAIESARWLEQEKVAAAAEERSRIARELHDSVTQTMYSVSIVADALPRLLERNLTEAKRSAAYLRQTTLGALAEMRTLLFELRPDTLAKANLNVLLQQLADVLTGHTRVPVDVTIEGEIKLTTYVKISLYRIVQETFNNITRHARATHVWATLQSEPEQVILAIRDNGQGFDLESVPEERLGLQIMRERAEEIGASLKLESEPGQGTQVWVTWSVPAADGAEATTDAAELSEEAQKSIE